MRAEEARRSAKVMRGREGGRYGEMLGGMGRSGGIRRDMGRSGRLHTVNMATSSIMSNFLTELWLR